MHKKILSGIMITTLSSNAATEINREEIRKTIDKLEKAYNECEDQKEILTITLKEKRLKIAQEKCDLFLQYKKEAEAKGMKLDIPEKRTELRK